MGSLITVLVFTLLAVGELVNDKLPKTPRPHCPAGIRCPDRHGRLRRRGHRHRLAAFTLTALGAGVVGAVLGTLGGYQARKRLVAATGGKDLPIALLEDAVAILGGFAIARSTAYSVTADFDAIIVGAGQAGPPLAGRLTAAGQRVAIVERKRVGGTCVNTGCIPTKTLVASAHAAQLARRGAEYGIGTGPVSVDMAKVKARKDGIMLNDRKGVESWLEGMDGCTALPRSRPLRGPAHAAGRRPRFARPTGSFSTSAAVRWCRIFPGLSDIEFLTNVSILELDTVPAHLVIVGGSYIALEFAQMYRRFGARVTVVETRPTAGFPRRRGCLRHHQGDPGGRRDRHCRRRRRRPDHQATTTASS